MDLYARRILTVSELTWGIKDILESAFCEVWVEGEISNLRCPPSGHLYFTLKDEESQIRGVIFRQQGRLARFALEDGLHVLCWGRVGVYERRGDYQLIIDYVEPLGIGSLQLAFEQLKARLLAEGLFDEGKKRPLPLLPRRIGIVTSPTGAAIRDMLNILRRRFENVEVLIYPVRVQGEGAAEEIAAGVSYLATKGGVDVIIVGRGGGSLEDLWAFNEEAVARAIAASAVPVISAVGHETDYTIADFVADVRAPTPSAAAELVVQCRQDLLERVAGLRVRLVRGVERIFVRCQERLRDAQQRVRDPSKLLEGGHKRLDELWVRLAQGVQRTLKEAGVRWERGRQLLLARDPRDTIRSLRQVAAHAGEVVVTAMSQLLATKQGRWERGVARLEALSPLAILGRGYSITRRLPENLIVRESDQVQLQDEVAVRLARGELRCRVEAKS